MLEHLIRKGLSPNAKGPAGDTPLISAVPAVDAALVKVLVGGALPSTSRMPPVTQL